MSPAAVTVPWRKPAASVTVLWHKVQELDGLGRTEQADVRNVASPTAHVPRMPCLLLLPSAPHAHQEVVLAALTEANVTEKTRQIWLLLKERAAQAAPEAWLSFAGSQAMKQQVTERQLQAAEIELALLRKQLLHHQSG